VAREKIGLPRMQCQSAGLIETASTFTKISSAVGAGFSMSASLRISGGPYLSHMKAFITGAPVSWIEVDSVRKSGQRNYRRPCVRSPEQPDGAGW
jgi:hypothetical protein